jgi:glycosyltransferase involved in cell wall biosynthesis
MSVGQDSGALPRALASVTRIADEIILVATTDDVSLKNMATTLGARVFNRPWADDFSAARNDAFARATKDWIFWLDADEWLDELSHREIQTCLASADTLAWLINIVDCSGPDGSPRYSSTFLPRLFRRIPDLRMVGRVHEHFEPDLNVLARRIGLEVRSSAINIFHDGYSLDRESEKLRRNARLIELELRDRPGQLFYQIRLSQALLRLSDLRAYDFLRQAWEQIRPLAAETVGEPPPEPLIAELLDSIIVRQSRGEFCSDWSLDSLHALAANWYPRWPPLLWRRANWKFKRGRMAEAAESLEEILRLAANGTYQRTPSFDCGILSGETQLNLGICYASLGQFDAALRCFSIAAESPVWAEAANRNMQMISKRQWQRSHPGS